MSDGKGVGGLREIEYDLEGSQKAAAARDAFFRAVSGRLRSAVQVSSSAVSSGEFQARSGRAFIARRLPEIQRRYETFLWLESQTPTREDTELLISAACLILEEETDRLLAAPARPLANRMAAAVTAKGKKSDHERAEVLEKWGAKTYATTLGTASLVLFGLRRALEQGDAAVAEFVAASFRPSFLTLLRDNALGPCLDRLRDEYRNPVCHRTRAFTAAEYPRFVSLLVGREQMAVWEQHGPQPCPPPSTAGFLHHLLAGSRLLPEQELPPGADLVERLSVLAAPRASSYAVEVMPAPAAEAGRLRDLEVVPSSEAPIRLGDTICFQLRATQDCYLTLIGVGTSGALSVLLPNAWCAQPRLTAGATCSIPGRGFGDFAFRLKGHPGRERVIALATVAPLPVSLQPPAGTPFLRLDATHVTALIDAVGRLDPALWACAACEFAVEFR